MVAPQEAALARAVVQAVVELVGRGGVVVVGLGQVAGDEAAVKEIGQDEPGQNRDADHQGVHDRLENEV